VVRRRHLDGTTRPVGGAFRRVALLRRPLAPFLTRSLGTYCADTAEPVVALTYDDGPHPEDTPRLLDLLAERNRTATFYVLARQVERHPEIARRIVADGHELALHGQDHTSLLTMSDDEAVRTVRTARDRVEEVVSVRLTSYRPPYGAHTAGQARGVRRLGLDLVVWSGVAEDWVDDAEERITERALRSVYPGGVILLHDDRGDPETLRAGEALPRFDRSRVLGGILDGLDARGVATTTVSDLLARHRPVVSRSAVRRS
jgi:peptidoglycan/xylan/chitin deacetylase (PgdA/CDA1 family)